MGTGMPSALAPEDILALGDGEVRLLDQTRLPEEVAWVHLTHWREVVDAIRAMVVRGAPAIGVAGAMGLALAAQVSAGQGLGNMRRELQRAAAALRSARPTAVNLAWAVDRLYERASAHPGPAEEIAADLTEAARRLHAEEVDRCERIARHARRLITRGARILTHCNAGALATGGYGTALGIVRAAHAGDPSVRVLVSETRPLLQGSRLTTWELEREGIPYTLITDSMAGAMMAGGRVSHVVVGADRIAANGDVVNKIGTYGLAVLAREHGIPLIVAAPTSTLDPSLPTAAAVPIEERSPDEVRALRLGDRPAAPRAAQVANPAFDRTPARLVSAIVTEHGVHRAPYERSLGLAIELAREEGLTVRPPGA